MELTPKQERFAQNIALKQMNQTEAYKDAYDTGKMSESSIRGAAAALAANRAVAERIAVLKAGATAAAIKKSGYELADAIEEAEDARQLTRDQGQGSAMVAAIKLKAQLAGHLVEKKEVNNTNLDAKEIERLKAMHQQALDTLAKAREAAELVGQAVPVLAAGPGPIRRKVA